MTKTPCKAKSTEQRKSSTKETTMWDCCLFWDSSCANTTAIRSTLTACGDSWIQIKTREWPKNKLERSWMTWFTFQSMFLMKPCQLMTKLIRMSWNTWTPWSRSLRPSLRDVRVMWGVLWQDRNLISTLPTSGTVPSISEGKQFLNRLSHEQVPPPIS